MYYWLPMNRASKTWWGYREREGGRGALREKRKTGTKGEVGTEKRDVVNHKLGTKGPILQGTGCFRGGRGQVTRKEGCSA